MADTNSPDTAETAPSSDERDLVAAGTADDAIEADILRRACEEAGIEVLVSEARGGMVEKLSSPSASWTLLVPSPDLEKARALIDETRAALEEDPDAGARAAEAGEAAEEAHDAADQAKASE
jgi:hypothetical protein